MPHPNGWEIIKIVEFCLLLFGMSYAMTWGIMLAKFAAEQWHFKKMDEWENSLDRKKEPRNEDKGK